MKKAVLSLVLGMLLFSFSTPSILAQGTPAFPPVWNQSETPDVIMPGTADRTVDGVWTWDAARKQATARWNNGAEATINVVTDDGKTIVMCRFDRTGSAVGMVADYVGVRQGNKISGKVFWRDPLRDKQRSGKWSATFGAKFDLTGTWNNDAGKVEPLFHLTLKTFNLEKSPQGTFIVPGLDTRARVVIVNDEPRYISHSGAMLATGKVERDASGTVVSIRWSVGTTWTRSAKPLVKDLDIDLVGNWTNNAGKVEPLFHLPLKTFRLEKTAQGAFIVPGLDTRARVEIFKVELVKNEPRFISHSGVTLATGTVERDASGTVVSIRWSVGSTWTRNR